MSINDLFNSPFDRRTFIKQLAYASALVAVQGLIPGILFASNQKVPDDPSLSWKKTPCRFCGVGCGLLVGVKDGKAVAVKGDPASTVNKGLCCVKGYHSVQALYGADRIKKAKIRKNGKMVEVPLSEALDLVASKLKETIKTHGKDSVAIYGSGQWSIPDGYVASKLFKGAIGTNNVEANARLCMASAVTGFMSSFGIDEPMGCYDDLDYADVFVLWGNNMAEMHPVLFSRILERKQKNKNLKIIDLTTRTTRTSFASDKVLLFKGQSDLAIANAICYEIIKNEKVNTTFVKEFCNMKTGKTNIGYGLEDGFKFKDELKDSSFEDFKKSLEDYTPEKVEKISGVSASDIRYLASLYADPNKKVMSLWCMGVNQHTRGTWMNNLIYNIHLLVGKISEPGNSPFSLTGQPSACGTVREVGTLTHRLPHGTVENEHDREMAAKIWGVPVSNIDPKPTMHTVAMFRNLDKGKLKFMWIQVTNPMVSMPKLSRYRKACQKDDNFIVVSDVYPTPTTDIADVILPSSFWIEREGMFGNSERRTQHHDQLVNPPGDCISDGWQLIEVARRMGFEKIFPWDKKNYIEKIWEEYSKFHEGKKHAMAPYKILKERPGVLWPFVAGKETKWRFNSKYDPACDATKKYHFYGTKNGKANIIFRPFEPMPEPQSKEYPFLLCTGRVIEHWHTGSLTRRIPILHQAVPEAYVEINTIDAKKMGIRTGDKIKITSVRGSCTLPALVNGRGNPQPFEVFVPFFDEGHLINEVTIDAYCPISAQPDYKKCAVRVEKV